MSSLVKRSTNYYLSFRDEDGKQHMERLVGPDNSPVTQKAQAKNLQKQRDRQLLEARLARKSAAEIARDKKVAATKALYGFKSTEEYARELEERQAARADRITPDDFIRRVEQWCIEPTAKGNRRSRNTLINYKNTWRNFFKHVKLDRLQDLEPAHVQTVMNAWIKNGVTPKGIFAYIYSMKSLMNKAIEWGLYEGANPLTRFGKDLKPRVEEDIPRYLSAEEIDALLKAAKEHSPALHLYVALMIYAGLRRAEAMNVRWEEFNFENRSMTLKNHEEDEARGIQEFTLKSGKSRTIPIASKLLEILNEYRQTAGYVVNPPRKHGKDITRFNRELWEFNGVRDAAGLSDDITPHALRHTFASILAQAGVPELKTCTWMGHHSPAITRIYMHLAAFDPAIDQF